MISSPTAAPVNVLGIAPKTPEKTHQTVVLTPHPTTALSDRFFQDFQSKIDRNKNQKYTTAEQVRSKLERYVEKRLAFLERILSGELSFDQDSYPSDIGLSQKAIDRLRQQFESRSYLLGPTVAEEGERALNQLSNIIQSVYTLTSDGKATHLPDELKSWHSRDNDRSKVKFGDQTTAFAKQVQKTCETYTRLLTQGEAPTFSNLPVAAIIAEVQACRHIGQQLQALVEKHAGDKSGLDAALQSFLSDPANSLRARQHKLQELCQQDPAHPFSQTFATCGLATLGGEVRLNAGALDNPDPASDDARRTSEIFREISLLDTCYPDTRSVVIADFSSLDQFAKVKDKLNGCQGNIAVIPLLESLQDVEYFLENVQAFKDAGVDTVMLAGSDLARSDGPNAAIWARERFNKACAESGISPYHGVGTATRRNGYGITGRTLYKDSYSHLFHPGPKQSFTVQGAQANVEFGNPALAAAYLSTRDVLLASGNPPTGAEIDEAQHIFANLTRQELDIRRDDGPFADLYRRNPLIQDASNLSKHHGSRDAKKKLDTLFKDRAIGGDAAQQVFNLGAAAFASLEPNSEQMVAMVSHTQKALAAGNPVVRDIVLNYAMQAASLYFGDQCKNKWQAANFAAQDIASLDASRLNMLHFLHSAGFDMAENVQLQRYVMEYLSIANGFDATSPAHNLQAIEARMRGISDAGVAMLGALKQSANPALTDHERNLQALQAHLKLTQAYALDLGAKS